MFLFALPSVGWDPPLTAPASRPHPDRSILCSEGKKSTTEKELQIKRLIIIFWLIDSHSQVPGIAAGSRLETASKGGHVV